MSVLNLKAYAKINLHLDVPSRFENGFHEVRTVMQSISLCDDIELSLAKNGKIILECDGAGVPNDSSNLAWRAADMFFRESGAKCGASIKIKKRIPVAAGLAGGSADAAAVLWGLETLCGDPLGKDLLLALGSKLGSDVPFCIKCGTAYADGRGDVMHYFPEMPDCVVLVSRGGEGAPTPWAYGELDRIYNNFSDASYSARGIAPLAASFEKGDIKGAGLKLYNIFESAVLPQRPVAREIKEMMIAGGACGALMSGSGTAVFGIFPPDRKESAENVAELLSFKGYTAFVTVPIGKRF